MKSPAGPADMKVIQPRRVEPVKMLWTGGLLLAAIAFALWRRGPLEPDAAQTLRLTGQTMGTTYSVVIPDPPTDPAMRQDLEQTLADTLKRVNTRMSIYNPESEISRFNRHPAHSPFLASDELRTVVAFALRLAQTSGGAYDPTLGPLLRLWGFGPGAVQPAPFPDPEAIESAKRLTGSEAIRIVDKSLIKERPEIELDLNSVAKGFGVDAVARALREKGQNRYLVEVGGEIALAGLNPDGLPWRIGVDRPEPERAPGDRLSRVLRGTD
ncbi:MAG: FAD:protein FMN transferase, partial [Kiritimatiellia bacterium]|nr:FAD:protein FMN transferase [Kiritimatiellia bacterium]